MGESIKEPIPPDQAIRTQEEIRERIKELETALDVIASMRMEENKTTKVLWNLIIKERTALKWVLNDGH